jgi:replicative DNA helicase
MDLNDWMDRLNEGRIHVLAGRPGSGKTSVAIECLKKWVRSSNCKKAVYFSIEAQATQIISWLGEASDRVTVFDQPCVSPYDLVSRLAESPVGTVEWVVIDYLQLMNNRQGLRVLMSRDRIRTVFEDLESLARNYRVKVLVLSQLPRHIEDIELSNSVEESTYLLRKHSLLPLNIPDSIQFLVRQGSDISSPERSTHIKIAHGKARNQNTE